MLYLSNILSTPRLALFILIINMIDGSHFLCITQVCFCKSNTSKYHLHYAHNFLFIKVSFDNKHGLLDFKTQKTWQAGSLAGFKLFKNIIQERNFWASFNIWSTYIHTKTFQAWNWLSINLMYHYNNATYIYIECPLKINN